MDAIQEVPTEVVSNTESFVSDDAHPTVFVVGTDASFDQRMVEKIQEMRLQVQRYQDAQQFLLHADPNVAGCVLSGMYMNGMSGLELQATLVREGYTWPVIFVSAECSVHLAVRAMRAGAISFLTLPWREDELCLFLREAIGANQGIRSEMRRARELEASFSRLSPQEENILNDIYRGMTNKQIAANLDLSLRTIESRRQRLFLKTGSASLPDLIKRYHEALMLKAPAHPPRAHFNKARLGVAVTQ